jgi:iron complex outermembrane recepter protein
MTRIMALLLGGCWLMFATVAQAQTPAAGVAAEPLQEIVIVGSRIPRAKEQGPTAVTVVEAEQIRADGFGDVPNLLRALTQNGGETQSQQSFSGASFTPGAQQVDLRGLGPNHTLVLVNGRRIADFPLPFKGRSNFTDISNIPLGMLERVEVLSGSASAIYGSDAISGVVNFILKKKADGLTLDYRLGATEKGGGTSNRLILSGGWSNGPFNAVLGAELLDKRPLWAYDRNIQDSTADAPLNTADSENPYKFQVARRVFLRYDYDADVYVDPGAATCANLAYLNGGSTYYASRKNYGAANPRPPPDYLDGFYCGSQKAIGYGTIESKRRGFNSYAALSYDLGNRAQLFADIQLGSSRVDTYSDVLSWNFQDANGSEDGYFFNQASGAIELWQRQFTPEEAGGLANGYITNQERTLSVTPGIKGDFGAKHWAYELAFNHSQYESTTSWPEVVAAQANALYLGPQLGVDANSGYPIFAPDPNRLYTPLTRAEYDSLATRTVYRPRSRNDNLSFTVNNRSLFSLPAGPVGFAAVAEAGSQYYNLHPDPLALGNYYYGLRDSDGHGSRDHWGLGAELRAPLLRALQLSTAVRYDQFHFANNSTGRFTYNVGLEYRPLDTLLLRAAAGSGFRAPDLHYVYTGPGNVHPSATDYYLCLLENPTFKYSDCVDYEIGIVEQRNGNSGLKSETSTSLSAGVYWAPVKDFDVSLDYFRIDLSNEVLDLNRDSLLQTEADCRLGATPQGTPVDGNSPTCQDAIARVIRYPPNSVVNPNGLIEVRVNPVNVAKEKTDGYDLAVHYRMPTRAGVFSLGGYYTYVVDHSGKRYPGDPTVDQFRVDSGYDIPRSKASASLGWTLGRWTTTLHGERLDRLPNLATDAYIPATYLVNGTLQFKPTDRLNASLAIDNLLDRNPPRDPSYVDYPYYDISWFDSVGRSYFLQLTYKIGGM